MAWVVKFDPHNPDRQYRREHTVVHVLLKTFKDDPSACPGECAFIWYDYSQPHVPDGRLEMMGVIISVERAANLKLAQIAIAVCDIQPVRNWLTETLDDHKTCRNDVLSEESEPVIEIANKVRLYTHDHMERVSRAAAAVMAATFITT